MRELLVTNDAVILSFALSVLDAEGIESVVFDRHISLVEGSIGAFPRRLMVRGANWIKARRLMVEAGLGAWVRHDDQF